MLSIKDCLFQQALSAHVHRQVSISARLTMKNKTIFVILICIGFINSCEKKIVDPPQSQLNFEIVFSSNRDGNDEIYEMNADGSSQTRLTNNTVKDWFPKWSPDGEKIAYLSSVNGNAQLFVMNKDGSNQTQVTADLNIRSGYEWIEWSQDSQNIIVQAFSDKNIEQIYIVNIDGSNREFLAYGSYPNWTKQNEIIFGGNGICSINPDGSNLVRITDGTIMDFCPVVSPLSDKIVFRSSRDNDSEKASLHIMNMDGTGIKEISKKDSNIKPTWSPNNSEIAFVAPQGADMKNKIFRIKTNSNNEELLIDLGHISSSPVYSPDGDNIVFSSLSNTELRIDIYIKSLSDGSIIRLTNDKGLFPVNECPDWNPKK